MRNVQTFEEAEKQRQEKVNPVVKAELNVTQNSTGGEDTPRAAISPKRETKGPVTAHYLSHPDMPADGNMGGNYQVENQGKIITLEIIGGMIRTTNFEVRKKLEGDGFVFMYSAEENNE